MTDIDPIQLARLQRAFDRLPRLHGSIFSAVRHDGMSYVEIAGQTGLTERQVEHVLADALYRLVCDVSEQEHGIAIGPIRRFVRARCRDGRLWLRLMRAKL